MQIVDRGPLTVVGIEVVARWEELWTEAPKAWQRLFGRAGEIRDRLAEVFLDVSVGLRDGVYTQVVGAEVSSTDAVPEGMAALQIPAQRYLHLRHEGPVEKIAASFGRMYAWAEEQGLPVDEFKLDVGYTADGAETVHDLYVRVAS